MMRQKMYFQKGSAFIFVMLLIVSAFTVSTIAGKFETTTDTWDSDHCFHKDVFLKDTKDVHSQRGRMTPVDHGNDSGFVPNELLLKFTATVPLDSGHFLSDFKKQWGIQTVSYVVPHHRNKNTDFSRLVKCIFANSIDVQQMVHTLSKESMVEYVQPNYYIELCLEPNDPYYHSSGSWGRPYPDLYGLHNTNCSAGWDVSTGSSKIIVGVIDTGVDVTHEDLDRNMWINQDEIPGNAVDDDGDGFVDNLHGSDHYYHDGIPEDGYGHGSHCAATLGGVGNNSVGVVGVNWNVSIMAVKAFSNGGSSTSEILVPAFVWAVDQGAHVLSNSWSSSQPAPSVPAFEDMVMYAYNRDVTVVFAAGNSGDDVKWYCPQNMKETITIAAVDYYDQRAYFSNYGALIDFAAPGIDILSARANNSAMGFPVNDRYTRASGTSMSCPHAAGAAALLLSRDNSYTPAMIKTMLSASCDPLDSSVLGSGRLNVGRAMYKSPAIAFLDPIDIPSDGIVDITGSAWGELFESFSVSIGLGKQPTDWTELNSQTEPVLDDLLAILDTNDLNQGVYTIKLEVVCEDDQYEDRASLSIGNSRTYIVDDRWHWSGMIDFLSIQEAVDYAQAGDRIFICAGTYDETVTVNKPLDIVGENRLKTVITGGYSDKVLSVTTSDVFIKDITFRDSEYGVFVTGVNNVTIIGNNFINTDHPIYNGGLNNIFFTPSGGNYYDDYNGSDTNGDGVGDTPYEREEDNFIDEMPLMQPMGDCDYVPTDIYLDDDYDASTPGFGVTHFEYLQNAIYMIRSGGTIHINPGYYFVRKAFINKPLSLEGEGKELSFIYGFNDDHVLINYADNVTLNSLSILDSGKRKFGFFSQGNETRIFNCGFYNNWYAVKIQNTKRYPVQHIDHHVLSNSEFINNKVVCFWMQDCHHALIEQNTIVNNYFGLYFEDCWYMDIVKNDASSNYEGLILIDNTQFINISYNRINDNFHSGIGIDNGESYQGGYLNITHNVIAGNVDYGISMHDTEYNDVHHNYLVGNWKAVYLWSADEMSVYNTIHNNTIANNTGCGVHVNWDEDNNDVYRNNFINNYCHGIDKSFGTIYDNGYPSGGNYWDNYTGTDEYSGPGQNLSGSDGIGDTPLIIDEGQGGIHKDYYPFMNPLDIIIEIPPIARFSILQNQSKVHFNAQDSVDFDGFIVSYDWDFGDGTTGSGVSPNHIYEEDGRYTVTLTVTDDMGLTADCQMEITADGTPPEINLVSPVKGIYYNDNRLLPFFRAVVIGHVTIEANASDLFSDISYVQLYIDDELVREDASSSSSYEWNDEAPFNFRHTIKIMACDTSGNIAEQSYPVLEFL